MKCGWERFTKTERIEHTFKRKSPNHTHKNGGGEGGETTGKQGLKW